MIILLIILFLTSKYIIFFSLDKNSLEQSRTKITCVLHFIISESFGSCFIFVFQTHAFNASIYFFIEFLSFYKTPTITSSSSRLFKKLFSFLSQLKWYTLIHWILSATLWGMQFLSPLYKIEGIRTTKQLGTTSNFFYYTTPSLGKPIYLTLFIIC